MKVSFALLVFALVATSVKAQDKAEFSSRFEVVSCSKKSGCTGVDQNLKNQSHVIELKEIKKKDKNSIFKGDLQIKHTEHGENYVANISIVKSRLNENWIYTVSASLKNTSHSPTVVRTRDLSNLNALVVKALERTKKKKKIRATFYFGPARTTLF